MTHSTSQNFSYSFTPNKDLDCIMVQQFNLSNASEDRVWSQKRSMSHPPYMKPQDQLDYHIARQALGWA